MLSGKNRPTDADKRAVPKPVVLASQWGPKEQYLLETAFQSGKTSVGGAVSSTRRARAVSSMVEVNSKVVSFFRRVMIGQELRPPSKLRSRLLSVRMEMREKAATQSSLGRAPSAEMR